MADLTSSGDIPAWKPVNWPTGKPSGVPVGGTSDAETAGGVRGVPPRAAPARPGEIAPTEPARPGAPAAPARPAPSVARPLTIEDVRSHLLSLQVEPNDFNTKLASLMLRNGVEVSRANFVKLLNMLQGTSKSSAMQEAALLLLMKGIDSPAAVKILGQYFSENPALASQMLALQEGMGNLTTALGMSKGLLDATVISQLTALLSQFDENFQTLSEKFTGKSAINRGDLINNVRALKALLQGMQEKAPVSDSPEAQALSSSLMEFQGKLDGILQNLVAQAILSQNGRSEVNYHYQQIPNTMTSPPKNFEIVIKRDGEGKDSQIDPRNTQVVMSLETESMGKLVISMIVKDSKIYVVFVFAEKDYGEQGRGLIAKEFGGFQQKLADKNFLITGYQVKVDAAMCNIRPYLIPMLRKLEDKLMKIDIEA